MDDVDGIAKLLRDRVAGRRVALVGNASAILSGRDGAEIDRHCVVRMNAGIPTAPHAQGSRVDMHCFSTWPSLSDNLRRSAQGAADPSYFDDAQRIWMSAAERDAPGCPDCAFYPMERWTALAGRLGARPSVGAMTVDLFSALPGLEATLYGFDFRSSGTFYRAKQNPGPHDWKREREFVQDTARDLGWLIRDPRRATRSLVHRIARHAWPSRSSTA